MIFLSCVQYNLYFLKLQRFYLLNLYNYRCAKLVNFHNKISISKHRNTISWQWIVKRKLSVITFLCLCFKYLRFLQKSMFIHDQFILFFLWNTDTIIRAVNRRKVYNNRRLFLFVGDFLTRLKILLYASSALIHSNPSGSLSPAYNAGYFVYICKSVFTNS